MAKKIVLAGACRTAIGTRGGALSSVPAPELGAIVIKEALNSIDTTNLTVSIIERSGDIC